MCCRRRIRRTSTPRAASYSASTFLPHPDVAVRPRRHPAGFAIESRHLVATTPNRGGTAFRTRSQSGQDAPYGYRGAGARKGVRIGCGSGLRVSAEKLGEGDPVRGNAVEVVSLAVECETLARYQSL